MAEPNTSFYRRPLPELCVDFASDEGKRLFKESLAQGYMEIYFEYVLVNMVKESEPAYCGLGTLTMVLNSLKIDPDRVWKGPWRWFSEDMLDCCVPLEEVKTKGITIEEFTCLARCNGATARVVRGGTLEAFRSVVMEASKANNNRIVASYDRKGLNQTGSGHFSPVAGYHPGEDKVLILDVARFKYPPHWVPLEALFLAMASIDPDTNKSRGYIVVSKSDSGSTLSKLFKITAPRASWYSVAKSFYDEISTSPMTSGSVESTGGFISLCLRGLQSTRLSFFSAYVDGFKSLDQLHQEYITKLLDEIHQTRLYSLVKAAQESLAPAQLDSAPAAQLSGFGRLELFTVFLLAQPLRNCNAISAKVKVEVSELSDRSHLPPVLAKEVQLLSDALAELAINCCKPEPGVTKECGECACETSK